MARIGFLGTGEIASAMVRTIAGDGHAILVSERNARISTELAQRFDAVERAPNETVVDRSDIVIVCFPGGRGARYPAGPGLPREPDGRFGDGGHVG